MIKAKDMQKDINKEWIKEKWEELEGNTTGRKSFHIGKHVVTKATSDKFAEELAENGFIVSYGINTHGVKLLIVDW